MANTREQICQSASTKLAVAAPSLSSVSATVGLDGFVDSIIDAVETRQDATHYQPFKTLESFGKRIVASAGQSANCELIIKLQKLGGNGPIMANALASAGMTISYIGCLGKPAVHPVFADFAKKASIYSVSDPGFTDALEFTDGKLMLGKRQHLGDVNWNNIVNTIGLDILVAMFASSRLIAWTNWTMLPAMTDIWRKLQTELLPKLPKAERKIFIDLADPEQRLRSDVAEALEVLKGFQSHLDVILGLNLSESTQIANVLGISIFGDAESQIESTAQAIREKLDIGCVVIHPRKGAAAATRDATASFKGPFVQEPKISTGAGDHFNAGFCLARVLGLTLEESLCTGTATSGYYVRTAVSPTAQDLADFIAKLPPPQ